MTRQHPEHPTGQPATDDGGDLEYDLAHEAVAEAGITRSGAARPAEPVYVATETPDSGGDYSYDLAHDVPKQE